MRIAPLIIVSMLLFSIFSGCTSSSDQSTTSPTLSTLPPGIVSKTSIPTTAGRITTSSIRETAAVPTDSTIESTQTTQTRYPEESKIPTTSPTAFSSSGKMVVHFIDVGQGDSELIQFPSGKTMLIDAGPTGAGSTVAAYLRSQGISSLDAVVASHPHEDHIGGMSEVLDDFTVKQFIDSGYPHTTSTYENMLVQIDRKNIPFRTVAVGDIISLDPAVSIAVLNPQPSFSDDINQNSVALRMTYGKITWFFPGDAGSIAEPAEILKVPHHGSSTGSSSITLIDPKVSVIEVGAGNSYGHPTTTTLTRLQQAGSEIYRTDQDGTIVITSDGETYSVSQAGSRYVATSIITSITPTTSKTVVTTAPTTAIFTTSTTQYSWTTISTTAPVSPSCTVNYETGTCPAGKCWVRDYCRKDGTHVNGYCRKC